MARLACKAFGIIFVAMGLLVIVRGADVDPYHNLLHLVTGVVALYFGFVGSSSGAKAFCLSFGAFYLALGGLGLALGDPTMNRLWQIGPLSLDMGDHGFHIVLGAIFLASGLFAKRQILSVWAAVSGRSGGAAEDADHGADQPSARPATTR